MSQLKRRPADEAALVVQLHLIRRRAKAPAADKHLRLLGRKLGNKQTNKKKTNTELVEPADRVRLLFFFSPLVLAAFRSIGVAGTTFHGRVGRKKKSERKTKERRQRGALESKRAVARMTFT